jgi:hypothetical protein
VVEKRDRWLNPEGATEEELKKRTLTNLYSFVPSEWELGGSRLINPQSAIGIAYGWPHAVSDEEILARLLALNLARAAA